MNQSTIEAKHSNFTPRLTFLEQSPASDRCNCTFQIDLGIHGCKVVGSGFNPTRTGKMVLQTWDTAQDFVGDFVEQNSRKATSATKTNNIQLGGFNEKTSNLVAFFFREDSFGPYFFQFHFVLSYPHLGNFTTQLPNWLPPSQWSFKTCSLLKKLVPNPNPLGKKSDPWWISVQKPLTKSFGILGACLNIKPGQTHGFLCQDRTSSSRRLSGSSSYFNWTIVWLPGSINIQRVNLRNKCEIRMNFTHESDIWCLY